MDLSYRRALLVQLLLMASVYVVYLRCHLQKKLKPPKIWLNEAPADRLVVFIIDGLTAKSFFEDGCSNLPYLKEIFLKEGQVGIIRGRATNRTTSPYLTLVSGRFDDYFSTCHRTPVDTIFTRSAVSYVWCAPELQHLFNATYKFAFSQTDTWVLSEVQTLLLQQFSMLMDKSRVLVYVQLSELSQWREGEHRYLQQLNKTQHSIWTTYKLFEHAFADQRTAYLLTSNQHKPSATFSNSEKHSKKIVENPFMIWGAGVAKTAEHKSRTFVANKQGKRLPLWVLDVTQLATLMSGLLGQAPPLHNLGQYPVGLLDGSENEAHAVHMNAIQLVNQARLKMFPRLNRLFTYFLHKHTLGPTQLNSFEHTVHMLWLQKRFITLMEYCHNFLPSLLHCIDFYDRYYSRALLTANVLAYLGWLRQLFGTTGDIRNCSAFALDALLRLAAIVLLLIVMIAKIPWLVRGVLLLAPVFWNTRIITNKEHAVSFKQFMRLILLSVGCFLGFVSRPFVALVYLGFTCFQNRAVFRQLSPISIIWLTLVCVLTAMPWLPPSLGTWHRNWFLVSLFITSVRPFMYNSEPLRSILQRRWVICNGVVLFGAGTYVIFSSSPAYLQLIARASACLIFFPYFRQHGSNQFIINLSTLYSLLSTSYESLIIQLLSMELQLALQLRQANGAKIETKTTLAMYMLLYTVYSLFVIGNLDAVDRFQFIMGLSGFGLYSTLTNASLVFLKISIPILMLMCIINDSCKIAWIRLKDIFRVLLIMSNSMAILSLFRLKDEIIWWEDSIRLVQFNLVQVWPFLILMLCHAWHFILGEHQEEVLELPKWNVNES